MYCSRYLFSGLQWCDQTLACQILNRNNILDKGRKLSNQSTDWLEEKGLEDLSCEGDSLQGWGVTDTNS